MRQPKPGETATPPKTRQCGTGSATGGGSSGSATGAAVGESQPRRARGRAPTPAAQAHTGNREETARASGPRPTAVHCTAWAAACARTWPRAAWEDSPRPSVSSSTSLRSDGRTRGQCVRVATPVARAAVSFVVSPGELRERGRAMRGVGL